MTGSRLARISTVAILVVFAAVVLESARERSSAAKPTVRSAGASSTPLSSLRGGGKGGTATIKRFGGRLGLEIKATLRPSREGEAYQVWLYNNRRDSRSLGAQVADKRGRFKGAGPLPRGSRRYRYIDVSRESIKGPRGHSGRSVLRGPVPAADGVGRTRTIVEATDIGRLSWVCDADNRSSTTLSLPRLSGGVTVTTRSDRRRLWRNRRVGPGTALATPFERLRRQRWRIVYRHSPATIIAKVKLQFGVKRLTGDCYVRHAVTDITTRPN